MKRKITAVVAALTLALGLNVATAEAAAASPLTSVRNIYGNTNVPILRDDGNIYPLTAAMGNVYGVQAVVFWPGQCGRVDGVFYKASFQRLTIRLGYGGHTAGRFTSC